MVLKAGMGGSIVGFLRVSTAIRIVICIHYHVHWTSLGEQGDVDACPA